MPNKKFYVAYGIIRYVNGIIENKTNETYKIIQVTKDGGYCLVGVETSAETITNIRSKSKNLRVNLLETVTDKTTGGKWYKVEIYAKKAGIYKASYTYTNALGKKQNKVLKVKATDENPYKTVKIGKNELEQGKPNYIKAKKGKLKVRMNAGYKLKKIELYRNKTTVESVSITNTDWEVVTVKNNSTIEIPSQPYIAYRIGRNSYHKINRMNADSILYITYVDKYSKEEKTIYFYMYKQIG